MSDLPSLSINFSDCPVHLEDFFLRILSSRYQILREERPEFLIYALTGHRHRLYNCTKIYTHHEVYRPNWRECDYAILPFLGSDPRHYYLPIFAYNRTPQPLIRHNPDWNAIRTQKTRFCALLSAYANRSVRQRMDFFNELNRRKKVDSLGRAANNTGLTIPLGLPPKLEALRPYKFTIAFENKELSGWTTEKMYDPLAAHTIPIFWGDPKAVDCFNPEAFINAYDFQSYSELADYVCEVDSNEALYLRYLQAPPFRNNTPPDVFSEAKLLDFFGQIFTAKFKPVAQRRWFFQVTKWRLAKRNKLFSE
jgi:alpha(1,3/1,4) fucosyltransferase